MADMKKKQTDDLTEITVSAVGLETAPAPKKGRRLRYGVLATVLTAVMIAVVIIANMVFSVLTDSFSWSIDMTSTGMYKISNATKQVVDSVDPEANIEVIIFYNEEEFPSYIGETVKRFCNLSPALSYRYIDPEKNPKALTQYGSEYNITEASIVVKNGDRIRVFGANEYASYDDETGSLEVTIEEKLAAGILFVTKDEIPKVYFLNGNGESGYEALMSMLANNGADVEEVNLMVDDVEFNSNSKVIVITNPIKDYSDTVIRRLNDFMDNGNEYGRNIMYFSSAEAQELPNIEKFLADWGIAFNDDYVLDSTYCVGSYPNLVIPLFTSEDIMNTGIAVDTVTSPIMAYSRSIDLLFDENGLYKTQSLINSIDKTSYSKPADSVSDAWAKSDTDKSGPFDLAALSMKYNYINNIQVQSYLFASGSAYMITEDYLDYTGNGEFLMQLYKIMVNEQDDTIVSARKSSARTVALLTATQSKTMEIIVIWAIPCIFLIIGIIVYLRRRFM